MLECPNTVIIGLKTQILDLRLKAELGIYAYHDVLLNNDFFHVNAKIDGFIYGYENYEKTFITWEDFHRLCSKEDKKS